MHSSNNDHGFTLIECLIACALLATALLSIGHLSTTAIERITDARVTTLATMLATAKLEELATARAPVDGRDVVDSAGQVVQADSSRRFERRWSVAAASPDAKILTVVVSTFPGRAVRMTGGWTLQP